jgi:hypothetical protein
MSISTAMTSAHRFAKRRDGVKHRPLETLKPRPTRLDEDKQKHRPHRLHRKRDRHNPKNPPPQVPKCRRVHQLTEGHHLRHRQGFF